MADLREQITAAWTDRRAGETQAAMQPRPPVQPNPLTIVYASDVADVVLATGDIEPLVLHYLRDNPHPKSLRQHAGAHAKWAREPERVRNVRRRCAVMARAQLIAARRVEVSRG